MGLPEPEVVVRCPGVHLRLSGINAQDPYEAEFSVELHAAGLDARLDRVIQSAWDRPLVDFLDELVADFRGWEGERVWGVANFAVTATFHPGGHVDVTWRLQPWDTGLDAWEASVTTRLEAGEQLRNLAAEVREFFSAFDQG
ncbi:hypothetical protein GCM10010156_68350 [Planobispora rosea]|uniref:Uncharacterized protein n=1 Tax=Planobispora rosea TaxID=35762 RepID=A0A8J3SEC4_PLARO|nr:DUF6228 family protein [Planobispora rosea]GGT00591.1 hypothetical protein GCM10010156_68350 [Planobispora rosea]GIH88183.1 hypothetical protein Pro02_65910 [Planobispora rosea]